MTVSELKNAFCNVYGGDHEDIRLFTSPGRVNMIGEHTDYNGGVVFPAALRLCTTIALRPRTDSTIRLSATDLPGVVELDINQLESYKDLSWGDYQAGVVWTLAKAGYDICPCDMLYDDTVPHGGGLSSSAAIEVATALAFATLSNEKNEIKEPINMIEMARLSQKAENEYIGVSCGIMDQFASAMGKKDFAIFLNCRDLSYRHIPLRLDGYKIIITNTNKKRSLADSKYNERRAQCEEAVRILSEFLPGISVLADVSPAQFAQYKHKILDEVIRNRAQHVIEEIDRVYQSITALEKNDIALFGVLMNSSHDSLRDLYEVTGKELDTLVEEARLISGTIGSRMTGAGFGGCTVSIVKDGAIDEFILKVGKNYLEKTGLTADFYISEVGDGGREIQC